MQLSTATMSRVPPWKSRANNVYLLSRESTCLIGAGEGGWLANVSPYIRQHVLQLFVFALFFQMHFPGQKVWAKVSNENAFCNRFFHWQRQVSFFFIYYSFFYFIFFWSNLAIVDDDGIWKSGKHAAMTLNEHSREGKVAGGVDRVHTHSPGVSWC